MDLLNLSFHIYRLIFFLRFSNAACICMYFVFYCDPCVRLSDSFHSVFCIICGIYADIIYKMHIFKHAEDFFRNNQKKQLQIICVYSIILIKIMNRKTQ